MTADNRTTDPTARRWWIVQHGQLPTFWLDGRQLGIVSQAHAARIAADLTGRPVTAADVHPHSAGIDREALADLIDGLLSDSTEGAQ